jgi:hypothetical protein
MPFTIYSGRPVGDDLGILIYHTGGTSKNATVVTNTILNLELILVESTCSNFPAIGFV